MKASGSTDSTKPQFLIRFYLVDGSVQSFTVTEPAEATRIWEATEPSRFFSHTRLVLAGEHFKSVFVTDKILRVDFVQSTYKCWQFPADFSDVVELSEEEFNRHAHLAEPHLMAKRNEPTPVGDLRVSFLKLQFVGGISLFLMVEFAAKLPAESESFMHFLLSKGAFHMRLRGGGTGIVNLAHLAAYTVYPGVAQLPGDTWVTERVADAPRT